MKIAFAIERFDACHGGAERYAWGLARWLVGTGHQLTIYTKEASPDLLPGTDVRILDVDDTRAGARRARFARALSAELAKEPYDVIHGFNHVRPCDILRLGGGVHLAYEKYNALIGRGPLEQYGKYLAYRLLPRYREPRVNERLQFADPHRRFVAVSQRVADDMMRFYPHCRDRVLVIRNAPDLTVYHPDAARIRRANARRQLGLAENTLVFLFASNNYRLKGLHSLILAMSEADSRLPDDVVLLVVGRDDKFPFERRARSLGLKDKVRFCGPSHDLLGYYGAADALLHPTYYDACANVCLEAMACGLPVLTSYNNGASEVMQDGDGAILVDMPCAPGMLADALMRMADPAFREAAGEAQLRRAEAMPVEKNYESVLSLYKSVADEKARCAASASR